jgi:hypothetical protein
MNDHSRSIDIRIHGIRQDYLDGAMRIGGVSSTDNTSDILTKNLQPNIHHKHCTPLHISQHQKTKEKRETTSITNNALQLTSNIHKEMLPTLQQRKTTRMPKILSRHVPIISRTQHQPTQPQQPTIQLVNPRKGENPTQPSKPRMRELRELDVGLHIRLEDNPRIFITHSNLEQE